VDVISGADLTGRIRERWPRAYQAVTRLALVAAVLTAALVLRTGLEDPPAAAPPSPAPAGRPAALLAQYGPALVRYDVDGGNVRTRELPGRLAGNAVLPGQGWVTSGNTVLVTAIGDGQIAAVVLSRDGRLERVLPRAAQVLPVPHGRGMWLVRAEGPTGSTVQEYALTGQARGFAQPVPSPWRVSAALRDVLVLARPAEPAVAFWRPGQPLSAPYVGGSRVVSAAPDAIVAACDPDCGFAVLRPRGPTTTVVLPSGYEHAGDPVLSQDGTQIAVMAAPSGNNLVREVSVFAGPVPPGGPLRLVPGSRSRDLFAPQPGQQGRPVRPSWSVDGQLFGFAPGESGVYRYLPGEDTLRSLGVRAPGVLTRLSAA
jgi:hypothetical protein